MKLLNIYKNGNYLVKIYDDGTKERILPDNYSDFNASFPENMDVKITDKCSQNCPFCYEGCSSNGKHAILFYNDIPAWEWMNHVHAGTEIAINGNDLDHPELERFLKFMKDKGVIVNITVNQNQFMNNFDKLYEWTNHRLISGLGVSLQHFTYEFDGMCKWFPNLVIHTIYGVTPIEEYMIMENRNYRILILGYKMKNRGISWMGDKSHSNYFGNINVNQFKDYLGTIINNERKFKVISFDNLALEQLNIKRDYFNDNTEQWNKLYQGDDGTHTFYMDLVKGVFAKSSTEISYKDINNMTCEEMLSIVKSIKN